MEQLRHGPGFALGPQDALVCLDGGGPASARLSEVASAIEARGTRVHRFAARDLGEPLSVFALTATVQRIALDFALQLGTDPDHVSSRNGTRSNSRSRLSSWSRANAERRLAQSSVGPPIANHSKEVA